MRALRYSSLLIIILFVCSFIFYFPYKKVREKTKQSAQSMEYSIGLQAKKGIEEFFSHYTTMLSYLSKSPHMIDLDDTGRKTIDGFYEQHSEEIRAVTRIDAKGRIIYTVPFNRSVIGRDVSYQDHNRLIIAAHQPVVSDVFEAVQGYRTLAYAFPVFDGETYMGSLSLLIPFEIIARDHVAEIKTGKGGFAWIIGRDGVQLYSPLSREVGRPAMRSFEESPELLEMTNRMTSGKHGFGEYTFDHGISDGGEPLKYLAAFTRIDLPNNYWSIAVTAPEKELLRPMNSFRNKWGVVVTLFVGLSLFFAFIVIKAWVIVEESRRRKHVEKALEQSESRFSELARLLPQTIFEISAEGRVTFLNEQGMETTGYSQEDLDKGLDVLDLQIPSERSKARENISRILQGEDIGPNEYTVHKKNGEEMPCLIHSRAMQREGQITGLTGILIDLTDIKRVEDEKLRMEAQLRQAQKMEAIGRLAGGIAHDFNNILNAVIGYADLAALKIADKQAVKDSLEAIAKAGDRAQGLVKRILAFSRKNDQQFEPLSLCTLIGDGLKLLRPSIPSAIDIKLKADPDCGSIMADATQMHQIIINLVTNAVHAMDGRGTINIQISKIFLSADDKAGPANLAPGHYLKLSVKDTGRGMDDKMIDRIFDPFFTTKKPDEGTGMGLSVVHGIVESHGGTIMVESAVKKGTVFHVFLPMISDKIPERKSADARLFRGTGRIMFVDDEEAAVNMAKGILEHAGYIVDTFTKPLQALKTFEDDSGKYALVITDQTMPDMTGLELSKRVLSIKPVVPVILCSGYSESISEEKAMSIGIRSFIMKPVNMKELTGVIKKLLSDQIAQNEMHSQ